MERGTAHVLAHVQDRGRFLHRPWLPSRRTEVNQTTITSR